MRPPHIFIEHNYYFNKQKNKMKIIKYNNNSNNKSVLFNLILIYLRSTQNPKPVIKWTWAIHRNKINTHKQKTKQGKFYNLKR